MPRYVNHVLRAALGRVLVRAREASGMTQQQASKRLRWSQARLSRKETASETVWVGDLVELAAAYGTSVVELVRRTEQLYEGYQELGE